MPVGNPQVREIWIYNGPGLTASIKTRWDFRVGQKAEIVKVFSAQVKIRFLEPGDPAEGTFSIYHFKKDSEKFTFYASSGTDPVVETEVRVKRITEWTLAEKVIPESRLTLLYGPPGTGKTTAGNKVGLKGGEVVDSSEQLSGGLVGGTLRPVFNIFNITLTEETPAAELRGHYIMKGGEFLWQDGTGLMPFRSGGRLVLNEIDKASGDCLQFCHALLDDPGISAITLPTGETVTPHEDFTVVATMNGVPEDLPEALRDRFAVRINIKQPHPEAVKSLPADLRDVAKKSFTSVNAERQVSFRAWKAFAQLREVLDEEIASKAVFGARAENILNTLRIERAAKETKKPGPGKATLLEQMDIGEEYREDLEDKGLYDLPSLDLEGEDHPF